MKHVVYLLIVLVGSAFSFGQTFQTTGNWSTGSNWSTGTKPSGTSTDVTVSASPTISTVETIGAVSDGNSIIYTITSTGSLSVGASGTPKNMTFNNSGTISISSGGQLEIWGDLVVTNNVTLSISGSVIVHGNLTMSNGGSVIVSGSGTATIYGSLTGQQNTHITATLGGTVKVNGAMSLGNGTSSISSSLGGSISAASCSCGGCGALTDCSGNVVLPITLLFFTASADNNKVNLQWATATEINFDYFALEKSVDGTHFLDIAHVPGSGFTNARKNYSFEDRQPFEGLTYYRLTSVDFDGYKETFDARVVSVFLNMPKSFELFPNPVSDGKITAKINFDSPSDVVSIYNNLGMLVTKCEATSPELSIAIPHLDNGVYVARFTSDNFSHVVRFVVAKN